MMAVDTATAVTTTDVDLAAGAVSHETADWHTIEWTRGHRIVRRRPARSTADAIERCFNVLSRSTCAPWILEGDLKSCFDRISHAWLVAHAPMDRTILRKWLKAGFMDKHILSPTEEGAPQGGPLSP